MDHFFEVVIGILTKKLLLDQLGFFLPTKITKGIRSSYSKITALCISIFTNFYFQRGGCVHGEELNYIFGYPLLRDQGSGTSEADKKKSSLITASTDSFSRNEANLALSIIQFWSNFAATG